MKIWIDFANSPHVPFFLPLMEIFKKKGHEPFVTLRDFSQTVGLARKFGIDGPVVGKHGGAGISGKMFNLWGRSRELMRHAKGKNIDIAVSHNSYTQVLAARLAGIRVVTLMDYEGQPANHLAFRGAHKVIVPEFFPDASLRKFGAKENKVYKYDGFKEQVYLSDFEPDTGFFRDLVDTCGLPPDWSSDDNVLLTLRTPATMAAYHRFENPLFDTLVAKLNEMSGVTTILLPRTKQQGESLANSLPNLYVPKCPLDGKNLVYHSDLVISAGGTMNREAAMLGTPAYTVFAGAIPAVDNRLIEMKRMIALSNENDLAKIAFEKKTGSNILRNPELKEELAREILSR